ncbi:serine hydrolase [Nonomuraea africana]|uniref:Beta-lactamase class A n=1 Tax=Nonomuraea africana TaxID=46171 RepID=A0ABR9K7H6_9ACTN|nr:serine hydrolase [Nonomuraea africana]MBE1557728.1 beta-lactamase class A [Nonomuraea africana]
MKLLATVVSLFMTAAPPLDDVEAVLAYVKAHPRDVALVTTDISHNAGAATPFASSIKIVHLEAYAKAVKAGKVRPGDQVPVATWNAYHLPGTDGGAHEAALKRLKVGAQATFDQLVSAMIEDSDNAATDLLREKLGLHRKVPTINGEILKAFGGCATDADTCIRTYAAAGKQVQLPLPGYDKQAAWADTVTRYRPAALHATLTRLTKDEIARKHLEWPMRQPGASKDLVIGTKGGSLPGVITEAMYTVTPGAKPRVTVFALRRLPEQTWASGLKSYAHQQFMLRLATDRAFHERVRAALK